MFNEFNERVLNEEEQIRAYADVFAKNLIRYGVNVGERLDTAVQMSYALEQAYIRGRHDECNKRWTTIKEGLPEKECELYWTTHEDGSVILHSYTKNDGFILNLEVDDLAKRELQGKVVAWMPIYEPEPYRE